MRQPHSEDPPGLPVLASSSSRSSRLAGLLGHLLPRVGSSDEDRRLRLELERLRIVQRQLEYAQTYLLAATQVPLEAGHLTKHCARVEHEVTSLIHVIERYRL
jgi:hypothetical protein